MLGQVFRTLLRGDPAGAAVVRERTNPIVMAIEERQASFPVLQALAARVASGLQQDVGENFDGERWGSEEGPRALEAERAVSEQCLSTLLQWPAQFQAACSRLDDDVSREWLLDLLAYRLLGHRHFRLPIDAQAHWTQRARALAMAVGPSGISGPFGAMSRFQVDFDGEPIVLDAYPGNVAWTFLIRQYYFSRGPTVIAPSEGDVVIDAGACFADTALAFAASVGPQGKVHAFEADPGNLEIARRNLSANAVLATRIEVHEQALGREAGTLYLHGSGPGARISSQPGGREVAVMSVDRFVGDGCLPRVDFIKMDIEGAEFDALHGAEETIRRWRPRLAVSVYHHAADLARIANWIAGLGLEYRLFLEHYTIHHEETVLYAMPAGARLQ